MPEYYSPSTSASSLSAVDAPLHPDPWLAPWMTPSSSSYYAPTIQLQLPDIETLPIQRPLLLADDPYKAQQSLLGPGAGPEPACLPYDYPTSVYAPRALQLNLHPVPAPVALLPPHPQPVRAAPVQAPARVTTQAPPADVPIACPTPLHAYNKFDALLGFDPEDLLRHDALHSTGTPSRPRQPTAVPAPTPTAPPAALNNPVAQPTLTTQHRRKRPHDECEAGPVSPRSKRARRSFSGSGVPERYPAAGAAPAVAREAPQYASAPRARRPLVTDRSQPHPRVLHPASHCYNYSNTYAYTSTPSRHHYPHAVVAQRPAR